MIITYSCRRRCNESSLQARHDSLIALLSVGALQLYGWVWFWGLCRPLTRHMEHSHVRQYTTRAARGRLSHPFYGRIFFDSAGPDLDVIRPVPYS